MNGSWTFVGYSAGSGNLTITIPGIPNVRHVLESASARINASAAYGTNQIVVSSSDGIYNNYPLGSIYIQSASGGSDEGGASGLDLMASPGATIVVSLGLPGSTFGNGLLVVTGHSE